MTKSIKKERRKVMEWIKDYWYVIVIGLVAAMFLFGKRTGKGHSGAERGHDHEGQADAKSGKSGHGCCH
jgi:hypothetical protein